MMKFLIFFLFIPVTFASSAPQCAGLAKELNKYEKDLQSKAYSGCNDLKVEDLVKDVNFAIPNFITEDMPGTSLSRKCSNFSTIEAEIQKLKVEQSVLDGFEKLKTSLQAAKTKTADRDAAVAKRNGKTFWERLRTAQSLEALVETRVKVRDGNRSQIQGNVDRPILEVIRQRAPKSVAEFRTLVTELCRNEDQTDAKDACNQANFDPPDAAIEDILGLVDSQTVIDEAEVNKYRNSLKIKRKVAAADGSTEYSFKQMDAEMNEAFRQLDIKEPMSKAHLKAIRGLSDFESAPDASLSKVRDVSEGLISANVQKEAAIESNKFMLHMKDSRSRQEYTVRHSMSVAWENNKDNYPNKTSEMESACNKAKDDVLSAISCHKLMQEKTSSVSNQTARSDLEKQMAAVNDNISYHIKLDQDIKRCEDLYKQNGEISDSCLTQVSVAHANLGEKIIQLNALKDKIGQENMDLMKLRNFALFKWEKNKCGTSTDATMDLCEVENSTLNKETKMTVSDALKVAILFTPEAKAEEEGLALCEDENIAKRNPICTEEVVSDVIAPIINEGVNGPTDAPDGGHTDAAIRDAWIGAGANLLKDALNYVIPRRSPPKLPNPYPYNFGPYNGGKPPMGIADTIMFNARFQGGYGFYMPTPGYQPYTAFGATSSMTPYRPIGGGGGLFR